MTEQIDVWGAILEGFSEPIVFVDTGHIIRYMNKAAAAQYQKWGGHALIGRSLMDCHNENSCRIIRELFARMQAEDLDDVELYRRPGQIAYMKAVRDGNGTLIGYYERYEAISEG